MCVCVRVFLRVPFLGRQRDTEGPPKKNTHTHTQRSEQPLEKDRPIEVIQHNGEHCFPSFMVPETPFYLFGMLNWSLFGGKRVSLVNFQQGFGLVFQKRNGPIPFLPQSLAVSSRPLRLLLSVFSWFSGWETPFQPQAKNNF